MLKILSNYLKYSGIWMGLVINPYHWELKFQKYHPDELNPNMYGVYYCIGPIWIRLIIDNGSW